MYNIIYSFESDDLIYQYSISLCSATNYHKSISSSLESSLPTDPESVFTHWLQATNCQWQDTISFSSTQWPMRGQWQACCEYNSVTWCTLSTVVLAFLCSSLVATANLHYYCGNEEEQPSANLVWLARLSHQCTRGAWKGRDSLAPVPISSHLCLVKLAPLVWNTIQQLFSLYSWSEPCIGQDEEFNEQFCSCCSC